MNKKIKLEIQDCAGYDQFLNSLSNQDGSIKVKKEEEGPETRQTTPTKDTGSDSQGKKWKTKKRRWSRRRFFPANRWRVARWAQTMRDVSARNDLSDLHKRMLEKLTTPAFVNWAPSSLKKKFANFMVFNVRFEPKYAKEAERLFDILKLAEMEKNTWRRHDAGTVDKDIAVNVNTESVGDKIASKASEKEPVRKQESAAAQSAQDEGPSITIKQEPVWDEESAEEKKEPVLDDAVVRRVKQAMDVLKQYISEHPDMKEVLTGHMAFVESLSRPRI